MPHDQIQHLSNDTTKFISLAYLINFYPVYYNSMPLNDIQLIHAADTVVTKNILHSLRFIVIEILKQ